MALVRRELRAHQQQLAFTSRESLDTTSVKEVSIPCSPSAQSTNLFSSSSSPSQSRLDTRDFHLETEANKLSEFLLSDTPMEKIKSVLQDLPTDELHEQCTTILPNGHTIVHLMAQRYKVAVLRAILHRGVDVHTRNGQGNTPLYCALHYNALLAAKVLLEFGANPKETASRLKGTSLLHMMVSCDRVEAAALLLEEGADPNVRDHDAKMPLHVAATLGNLPICTLLVYREQCDVNALDGDGRTALMLAIINNNQELARQMLDAPRVDIAVRDRDSMTCLHLAVSLGQVEVVRGLLKRNTTGINSKERRMGRTPIHLACSLTCDDDGVVTTRCFMPTNDSDDDDDDEDNKKEDVATVQNGVTNGHSGTHGCPSLDNNFGSYNNGVSNHINSVGSQKHFAQTIVVPHIVATDSELQVGAENDDVESPNRVSSDASSNGFMGDKRRRGVRNIKSSIHVKSVSTDLATARSSSRTVSSRKGKKAAIGTTLSQSTLRRHSSVVGDHETMLLKSSRQGAQTKASYIYTAATGRTRPSTAPPKNSPVCLSGSGTRHSFFGLALNLKTHQAIVEGQHSHRSQGTTTASSVTVTPHNVGLVRYRLVSLLLEHGADPNLMTTFRKSPLHITAITGAHDVLGLLLPHVTNLNMLSANNKTALHMGVQKGFTPIVAQLIEAGASMAPRDIRGMTALHHAAKLGLSNILANLLQAGADPNCNDFKQRTPLHYACIHNHLKAITLLTKGGASSYKTDVAGFMPHDYLEGGKAREKVTETITEQPDAERSQTRPTQVGEERTEEPPAKSRDMDFYLKKVRTGNISGLTCQETKSAGPKAQKNRDSDPEPYTTLD